MSEGIAGFASAMIVAVLVDVLVGWPDGLYRRVGHPVTWIGWLIGWLEIRCNRGAEVVRRLAGVFVAVLVIGLAAAVGWAAQSVLPEGWVGVMLLGVLAWPLVAVRSMYEHVAAVARPLASGDLAGARRAVAMIVGRDPEMLDSAGVARAALESLAENTSDGIVAPLFWGALLGLPGIAAYKAINTLDSMIGHRSPRYLAFGWASARIDDLVNLAPARITGLLFALVCGRPWRAVVCMARDAGKHRSPNAGWPEAAMAGVLGVRLSGPRVYGGGMSEEPWVNIGAPDPGAGDIARALDLYRRAMILCVVILAVVAVIAAGGRCP